MKKIFASLIFLLACALPVTAHASAEKFNDVHPSAWYYEAVDYATNEGLFSGTSATTFSPNASMTRGMFVTVLGRNANVSAEQPAASSFTDVATSDWCAPYVEWAAKNGIVGGMGNGKFGCNDSVTREQIAQMLYGYAQRVGCGEIQNGTEILKFPDTGDVSDWAKEAMTWAVDKEVLSGLDGKLAPQRTATRAQVAQIFYNCRDLFADASLETPGRIWVVDVPGHYETIERLEWRPVVVGEVGHWEDVWYTEWVYRCNKCGFIAETVEGINKHLDESINWDTMTGCGSYTMVSGEPIYTGEKYWVVDVPGRTELKMVIVTEQVWVDEVGHWE